MDRDENDRAGVRSGSVPSKRVTVRSPARSILTGPLQSSLRFRKSGGVRWQRTVHDLIIARRRKKTRLRGRLVPGKLRFLKAEEENHQLVTGTVIELAQGSRSN